MLKFRHGQFGGQSPRTKHWRALIFRSRVESRWLRRQEGREGRRKEGRQKQREVERKERMWKAVCETQHKTQTETRCWIRHLEGHVRPWQEQLQWSLRTKTEWILEWTAGGRWGHDMTLFRVGRERRWGSGNRRGLEGEGALPTREQRRDRWFRTQTGAKALNRSQGSGQASRRPAFVRKEESRRKTQVLRQTAGVHVG